MAVIDRIAGWEVELADWRRRLHAIPELDFDLDETAAFVAERLREIGVAEAIAKVPALRRDWLVAASFEENAQDVDVATLQEGWLRKARASEVARHAPNEKCTTGREDEPVYYR